MSTEQPKKKRVSPTNWGNPLPRCLRCKERKTHDQFNPMPGGKRRQHCVSCELGPRINMKTCAGCLRRLPRDQHFSRRSSAGFRSKCRECLPDGQKMRKCRGCGESTPLEGYPRYRDGTRKPHCENCAKPKVTMRVCRRCGVEKPLRENFPVYSGATNNEYHRGLACLDCVAAWHSRKAGVQKFAKDPCARCGQIFVSYLSTSRVDKLKYCGRACRKAAAITKTHHECHRCCKTLPVSNFDLKPNASTIRDTCRECAALVQQGKFGYTRTRISVRQMRTNLRKAGQRVGVTEVATETQLAKRVEDGCELCGSETYAFTPRDKKQPYTDTNLVAVCSPCRDGCDRLGVDALLHYCLLVSDGKLARELPNRQPMPSPKRRREKPATKKALAAQRAKDKWIHPTSPQAAAFGETFEQQLARVCQARADRDAALTDKRKKAALRKQGGARTPNSPTL